MKIMSRTAMLLAWFAAGNAYSTVSCEIIYFNPWNSGYQIDVKVTNSGSSSISAWAVTLNFSKPAQITNSWNVVLSGTTAVTASNDGNNGNLGPSQYVTFGIQGSHDGGFMTPACAGSAGGPSFASVY